MGLGSDRQRRSRHNFNPPIPCGMGLYHLKKSGIVDISIHPSRVGWDSTGARSFRRLRYFNPPIPCGMGPSGSFCSCIAASNFNPPIPCGMGQRLMVISPDSSSFQSTHPVWDGTVIILQRKCVSGQISIHPSRVGWDALINGAVVAVTDFNPPIPCGMGRDSSETATDADIFQSTHPVWDGTIALLDDLIRVFLISIHPSRVGWDAFALVLPKSG